ncbi:VOC family protein [Marinomonas agarivorans]|nr:VOC family protein [Marinomonas agarivorans]
MISHIDHIVLTVTDIDKSVEFFATTLGMTPITYANGRQAVAFGTQKINFQLVGEEVRNHALEGSGDVCFIAEVGIEQMLAHLAALDITILEGPVTKNGAQGEIQSIYFNDLDNNLIEIGFYPQENVTTNATKSQKASSKTKGSGDTEKSPSTKSTTAKSSKPRSKKSTTKTKN